MMEGHEVQIFTYNGIDGACAAASVLLKYPRASLTITSAKRIGESLLDVMKERGNKLSDIYVCGVGVKDNWHMLYECREYFHKHDISVFWICGRGYLDRHLERFEEFCTPVFLTKETNTAAVFTYLNLASIGWANELCEIACMDPNLEFPRSMKNCPQQRKFWIDLIAAAISQYFKFQDQKTYRRIIRNLSHNSAGESEIRLVERYRRHGDAHALRGNSKVMEKLRERVKIIAQADEHVVITGDSGVGKEYVAKLIHEAGPRTMEPINTVNCAFFEGNEALANSTLFGHVKGAFTGASSDREGAFVAADGGVLFLDELGELPLKVQGKLLRVIEDGWITPVGCDRPVRQVDVRIIAATNRYLPDMVRDGKFREDLFHRLDVLRVRVPSLREHPEDISYIAKHLMVNSAWILPNESLEKEDKKALESYSWPGNVRQLQKVLKRAQTFSMPLKKIIEEEKRYCISMKNNNTMLPISAADIRDIKEIQQEYAQHAYKVNGRNLADTARKLHVSPNTLKKYLDGS